MSASSTYWNVLRSEIKQTEKLLIFFLIQHDMYGGIVGEHGGELKKSLADGKVVDLIHEAVTDQTFSFCAIHLYCREVIQHNEKYAELINTKCGETVPSYLQRKSAHWKVLFFYWIVSENVFPTFTVGKKIWVKSKKRFIW